MSSLKKKYMNLLGRFSQLKDKFSEKYYFPNVYWWEWGLAGLILLFYTFSLCYFDLRSLTVWSTNFWDVLYEGRLNEFYSYTAQNLHHAPQDLMGCDIFAILPLSVWNFPIWIAQRFFNKDVVHNIYLLAWSKFGLSLCLVALSVIAYKICKKVTNDHHRSIWASILTLSSAACLVGVGWAGQNDIILALIGALSVYALMNKKTILFLVLAACSIAMKPFFAFALLPLLFLTDKNVFVIALKGIASLSVMAINRLLYSSMPMYKESISAGPTYMVLNNLFAPGLTSSKGNASYFLIALVIICFIAYVTVPKDDTERNRFINYIPAAVFLTMFCFSKTEFYRVLLVMPYLAVMLMSDKMKMRLNLILSFVFQMCYCLALGFTVKHICKVSYVKDTVFAKIFPQESGSVVKYANMMEFLNHYDEHLLSACASVLCALFIIAALILLVINFPRFKKQSDLEKRGVFAKYDHGLLLLNILTIVPFFVFTIMLFYTYK